MLPGAIGTGESNETVPKTGIEMESSEERKEQIFSLAMHRSTEVGKAL